MLKTTTSVINASQIKTPITFVGDVTLSTGNLVIGTDGKGIDFTVTSSGSGTMTSELLADYEEGTWTPTDGSGASLSFTLGACTYTKIGRMVTCYAVITYPVTASTAATKIQGFPFTPSDRTFGQIAYTSVSTASLNYVQGAGAFVLLWTPGSQVTNVTMSNGLIIFSVSYNV